MTKARTLRAGLVLASALSLVLVGCASTDENTDTGAGRSTGSEFDQGDPGTSDMGSGTDTGITGSADVDLRPVYFEYDSYALSDEARRVLRDNSQRIVDADLSVVIEGHCDARGSEEYNLALGDRRAYAVKKYVAALGVPESKIRTVSYGEAVPAVKGSDESAWRWNRRAQFRVSN